VSEVSAEVASGTVYLVTPKGLAPRKDGIFFGNEFSVMKEVGMVDKIIRIDYEYGRGLVLPDRDDDNVWWARGMPDPESR